LMAIDPNQISQFNEDGTIAASQLSLEFACRSCHNPEGNASNKSDEELQEAAVGYHELLPVTPEAPLDDANENGDAGDGS